MIFEEVAADSFYVGGASHGKFVRLHLEHMARTLPGPIIREWWVKAVDELSHPSSGTEDMTGKSPSMRSRPIFGRFRVKFLPPFESHAEKRWVKENKVSPYGLQEKLPVGPLFTPGVTENAARILGRRRCSDRGQPDVARSIRND
jgi:Putative oxalocrotonate tautomerase enzyme